MKIFRILFLLVGCILYGQEKNDLKITYEFSNFFSPIGNFDTYLYISNDKSQFLHHRKDGIHTTDEGYKVTTHHFKYVSNYDFKSKKVEENRILKDSTTLYAEWSNDMKWEITNEEKTINGYKVIKAITKSIEIDENNAYYPGNAIAWFAPDLPYSTGPARYYGLPGLILEIEYSKTKEKYTAKNIENIDAESYQFLQIDKKNKVEDKEDVIYFFHKNPNKIKKIQKKNK